MKKQIKNVIVHVVASENVDSLTERVNEFHIGIIQQRLNQSSLTKEQKVTVVNKIIENLYDEKNSYIPPQQSNVSMNLKGSCSRAVSG